jgi:hypothetical protein
VKKLDYVTYYSDGSIEVFGNEDGMPVIGAVLPAPDVNTASEEERERRHREGIDSLLLNGYFIESARRIRNRAFDGPGQKTTLEVKYRPCKTEGEIRVVKDKIARILWRKVKPELEEKARHQE